MRVLLIDSDPEEVLFFGDVLAEIAQGNYWYQWVRIEVLYASTWAEASVMLFNEQFEVILLDLYLSDSDGMETFRRAQDTAPQTPMVVLINRTDEPLGIRLIRDGAQDYLLKDQLDCAPLAHAMQNAIERHRVLTASRASCTHDTLTGLLNRAGFIASADRDRAVAQSLGRPLMVLVAEPSVSSYGEQRRDLALIEAADHLRNLARAEDLLARIETNRFAMSIFDFQSAEARVRKALLPHSIQIGTAIFTPDHPVSLDALLQEAFRTRT